MKQLVQCIELTHYHKILYRYMHTKINLYLQLTILFGPCLQKNMLWHFVGTRKMLAQQY